MSKGFGTVVSLHCMHVRNGTTHPVKWAACSLEMVLGMMISAIKISVCDDWGLFKDELGEARYLIRQGVIRIKIIVVIVRRTRHRQAHAGDSNSAFTNQFLLQTMLTLLSRSTRDGCKDRPNVSFAFGVRRPAELAALVSQRWHEWRQCWWGRVLCSFDFYYWRRNIYCILQSTRLVHSDRYYGRYKCRVKLW